MNQSKKKKKEKHRLRDMAVVNLMQNYFFKYSMKIKPYQNPILTLLC